jgi:diketogulonate reductase-like aldo/keto reductase
MLKLSLKSTLSLNNGIKMPVFGLGTFLSERGDTTRKAVLYALEAGYCHIDTAAVYGNEADVGAGVRESGIPRAEIFITTKVWNEDQGYDSTLRAFDASLERLKMDYVDLYLVHWPVTGKRFDTWRALIHLYEQKRCRAIGVSNYTIRHLNELLADSPLVPMVNQFELHPFNARKELVAYCQEKGIAVTSYSPLARGRKLADPALAAIASRYHKSPAQIAIRWILQQGLIVIPKSVHRERIFENAQVFDFEISPADMTALDGLNDNYSVVPPDWAPEKWV